MQRLKRYQAPTRDEAYSRVRDECGSEVEIISTRSVRMPGLFGAPEREYVEVVVRVSDEELERRQKFAARLAAARAEAATQRANDAVRKRTARAQPAAELEHPLDEPTVPAAELAAAIAAEQHWADDEPELAAEFVNDQAGTGLVPQHLIHPGLVGSSGADRAALEFPDDAAADQIGDDPFVALDGPFAAINAAADHDSMEQAELQTEYDARAYDNRTAAAASVPWARARAPIEPAPAVAAAEFQALAEQVGELKTMLRELALERAGGRAEEAPGGLTEARARLIQRGVTAAVAVPVLDQAAQALPRNRDEASVLRTVERKLAAQLPAVPRVDFARRPVVIFLVGPSGAGKTTLAVRLALDIRAHSLTAIVAGTDVGRAGGPQQLTAMGAATGVPIQLCYSPGELQALVNEGSADVTIVDTPGHTGARRDRMTELEAFMQAVRRRHTLLVLPATMQGADLSAVTKAYHPLGIEGLVVTRCDETATFGAIVSNAVESGIGIAYTTHADAVSVVPRGGDNLMLARAVVAGQWPDPPAALPGTRGRRTGARAG